MSTRLTTLTFKVLQLLGEGARGYFDLCEAILIAGYGASPSRIRRILRQREESRKFARDTKPEERMILTRYQKLLSKLKRDGLILERAGADGASFSLSHAGRNKCRVLALRQKMKFPDQDYVRTSSKYPLVVSFDIPQKIRRKRDWLREALKRLGLRMVHKSVWVGYTKLPKDFLDDLHELNLLPYIEVFEVGKKGSLERF